MITSFHVLLCWNIIVSVIVVKKIDYHRMIKSSYSVWAYVKLKFHVYIICFCLLTYRRTSVFENVGCGRVGLSNYLRKDWNYILKKGKINYMTYEYYQVYELLDMLIVLQGVSTSNCHQIIILCCLLSASLSWKRSLVRKTIH